ncbi:MAG: hypothetical protein K0S67_2244 [Nitrososphaeraceae archaeon]|nr:hypothetical protein [Nitrososphaeraceae archaeon]MCD6038354.1 hypothetical protein [Nitrososphaeraceae archaeon]
MRHTQTLYEHIECEKKDLQGLLLLSMNTLHIFLYHCHHKINIIINVTVITID